jgi:hypothetical protein
MAGMIITALSHEQGLVILVASPLICQGKVWFFSSEAFYFSKSAIPACLCD